MIRSLYNLQKKIGNYEIQVTPLRLGNKKKYMGKTDPYKSAPSLTDLVNSKDKKVNWLVFSFVWVSNLLP